MKQSVDTINGTSNRTQGYVYTTYGHLKYLKHAIASVVTLRRYDQSRPVALVCDENHAEILKRNNLGYLFDRILPLSPEHCSIVGFKHNLYKYAPFDRNLYLDSDIIWCKNPDPLWISFSVYPFTITGTQISDNFFGGPKHIGILKDILLQRRKRTLSRLGLTYLSRVQTGMIYSEDTAISKKVCEYAAFFLDRIGETHFQSRLLEKGRDEESCEWSMAVAMSKLGIPVYPWHQGESSPQLDFIDSYTDYDPDFRQVECIYYSDKFIYNLRGLKNGLLRKILMRSFSWIPGKQDYLRITPFCLHFGWFHQKEPFFRFSERTWEQLKKGEKHDQLTL